MNYHKNLSPYSLNMYMQCPRKFKNYKDKIKGVTFDNIYMATGKRIHSVISDFYKKYEFPVENSFQKAWQIWEQKPIPEQEKKAVRCFKNFKEFINKQISLSNKIYFPNINEDDVYSLDGGFHGIIDYYSRETRQIMDWKTNSKAHLDDDMIRQGIIYKYILLSRKLPVDRVSFFFLSSNKILDLPKKFNSDYILDIQKKIQLDNEFIKKPSSKCRTCPFTIRCFAKKKLWSEVIDRFYK